MTTNLVYFGSPHFSAQILDHLITNPVGNIKVVAVVTNPDRPVGRKAILTPSPVAQVAANHHLPVYKPEKLDQQNLAHIKLLEPHLFLVAAYGKIIPKDWINTPSISTLNIHFSLLPNYRGALCVSEPIKNQDKSTGVTLMEIDEQLDHGPIIAQLKQNITLKDNTLDLTKKLTQKAIKLLETKLPDYLAGNLPPEPQDHSLATHTPATSANNRANAFIPWPVIKKALLGTRAAKTHALIRSHNPDPGAWTTINNLSIKLIATSLVGKNLLVNTVQIPGKDPVSWEQFLTGHKSLLKS